MALQEKMLRGWRSRELFLELFQYRVGKYFEQIKKYIGEEKYPDARLKMFINKSSQILKENEDFFKFCLEFLSLGVREPEIRDVMTIFYKDSTDTFKQLLEEGVKAVDVDFDLNKQHKFHINNILTALSK